MRRASVASASQEEQRAAARVAAGVVRRSLGRFFATLEPGRAARNTDGSRASAMLAAKRGRLMLPLRRRCPLCRRQAGVNLYYHPVRVGWVAVAISGDGRTLVRSIAAPAPSAPPAELAAALFAPVGELFAGARRVVVFADRALRDVDFADLLWSGGALSERAAVAYGAAVERNPREWQLDGLEYW